jgi:hypothetical protein
MSLRGASSFITGAMREKQYSPGPGLFWKLAARMGGARLERATSCL